MKVLMINGSANPKGCTYTALTEVGKILREQGAEYEIFQMSGEPVKDCIGCNQCKGKGCVFPDNGVNEFVEKARYADGFVFGSPVYYAHPSGRLLSFLDRVFYCCAGRNAYEPFAGKPAAAVVSARRGGTSASLDVINKYFAIASMPVVPSTYWNMVHGQTPEEVMQDLEGLQTMRNIGKNLIWMMKCFEFSEKYGIDIPEGELKCQTNFIR